MESLDDKTLPIICGGTHYFIQHFLFPPSELSFDRPADNDSFDPSEVRWKPPGPRPPIPADLDPSLVDLLGTFWMAEPNWPARPEDPSSEPGPSRSRPTVSEDSKLLSIHTLLKAVDPNEAGRWHWRDGRKVRRGLERWWERGGGDVSERAKGPGRHARSVY
jgi:tRNA dimethylallyltransferase